MEPKIWLRESTTSSVVYCLWETMLMGVMDTWTIYKEYEHMECTYQGRFSLVLEKNPQNSRENDIWIFTAQMASIGIRWIHYCLRLQVVNGTTDYELNGSNHLEQIQHPKTCILFLAGSPRKIGYQGQADTNGNDPGKTNLRSMLPPRREPRAPIVQVLI